MSAILLLFALQVAAPRQDVARAQAIVEEARSAVEGDSTSRARRRWVAGLLGSRAREARLGLGTIAIFTYDVRDAERHLGSLLVDGGIGDGIALYAALGSLRARAQRWQPPDPTFVDEVLRAARALADPLAEAEALVLTARAAFRTSGADSALALLGRARAVIPPDRAALVAGVDCSYAQVLRARAPARADTLVTDALSRALATRDRRAIAQCQLSRAYTKDALGQRLQHREAARAAAEAFLRVRDYSGAATARQIQGYANHAFGRFDEARRLAEDAIRLGGRSGNTLASAWARLNLAQVAARLGDAPAAWRYAHDARRLLVRVNDRYGIATTYIVAGDAAHEMLRLVAARTAYDSAATIYARLGWESQRPWLLYRMAAVERRAGRLDAADSLLAAASLRDVRFRVSNGALSYARGLQALARGEYDAARGHFLRNANGNGDALFRFHSRVRLAEADARSGRLDDAATGLRTAYSDLARVRDADGERAARAAVLQSGPYEMDPDLGIATIIRILARADRDADAFLLAEAERERELRTQSLRRQTLMPGGTARPPSSTLTGPAPDLASLRAELPDSVALVTFVTGSGGETSTILLLTADTLLTWSAPPAGALLDDITRFARALEDGVPARGLARSLGRRLLGNALGQLSPGVTRLLIVPDGPLNHLPFDALELPDGRLLVERFTVSTAPSSRIALAHGGTTIDGPRVVAFGDPDFEDRQNLSRLAVTGDEVRAIARRIPEATIRTRRAATESALEALGGQRIGVLHLATHVRVEDRSLLSSVLYLRPGRGEDGRVAVDEIAALSLPVDLVVLTSSRTAGGRLESGEGLLGIASPFLEAGARAVLASHWRVNDEAKVPFIADFYDRLATGATAAEALRGARLAALRAGLPASVWAAFTLTGAADVRPIATR